MPNNNDNSQNATKIRYTYSQNQLHGDFISGDKVYGNDNTSKNMPMSKGILSESSYGGQEQFDRLYRTVFLAIERRPEDPHIKKGELQFIAESIYRELMHESTANIPHIRQWLKQLNSLAPDVFQTATAVLTSKENGLAEQTRNEIQKVRDDCQPTSEMEMPIQVYLENELAAQNAPPEFSDRMRGELEELEQAVHDGNVRPVRQILGDLVQMNGMIQPLRHWLVDSAGIPTAIKVFARNYLDSL